jgi:hypothetical protein
MGESDAAVFPVPSCPVLLSPQQNPDPEVETAQVLEAPAETELALMPEICTGVVLVLVVPSPTLPEEFVPQHQSSLFCLVAHACEVPSEIERTVVSELTGEGMVLLSDDPLPIW